MIKVDTLDVHIVCLTWFSVTIVQHWPKMCWRRKGFKWHTLLYPSPSFREVGQKLKQETGVRSWSGDYKGTLLTGLFHLACSASSHMELGPTCLGMVSPTVGGVLLQQLAIKKMLHRHRHWPVWSGKLFTWDFLLFSYSRLVFNRHL